MDLKKTNKIYSAQSIFDQNSTCIHFLPQCGAFLTSLCSWLPRIVDHVSQQGNKIAAHHSPMQRQVTHKTRVNVIRCKTSPINK